MALWVRTAITVALSKAAALSLFDKLDFPSLKEEIQIIETPEETGLTHAKIILGAENFL